MENLIITQNEETSAELGKLAEALSKAQGQMTFAKKDSANPFFKSKYADLASVMDAIREPLSKNGLAYIQTTKSIGENLTLVTRLVHSSGEWIKGEFTLAPQKKDAQGYGSIISYMRRYALSAMVGVVQDDDDGNAAPQKKPDFKPEFKEIEKQSDDKRVESGLNLLKFSDGEKETLKASFGASELLEHLQSISRKKMTKDDLFKILDLKLEGKDDNS